MTRHRTGDEERTLQLIEQQDDDASWLRHQGLAGELDRLLLRGATEPELTEVRPSWRAHVDHLRRVHNVLAARDPNGIWRIIDVERNPVTAAGDPAPLAVDEEPDAEYAEGREAEDHHDDQALDRIAITAQALAALAAANLLDSVLVKASVGMLIRQASESNHWHNCAHFRSVEARRMIEAAGISSAAAYQSFCRKNLRHEHVVPNSVIYQMLCALEDKSVASIEALLKQFCIRATITRPEDARLGQAGLASAMPHEFYEDGHRFQGKPLARYMAIGLDVELEKRAAARWFTN